jgi:uncharacterized protein (TIGR00251 family)
MKYTVRIKPNSRKGPLVEPQADGSLLIYIREPAAEGKANTALVELVAGHFGVAKSQVAIVRGHTSRHKIIEVQS